MIGTKNRFRFTKSAGAGQSTDKGEKILHLEVYEKKNSDVAKFLAKRLKN
jgi:hypothetical protein